MSSILENAENQIFESLLSTLTGQNRNSQRSKTIPVDIVFDEKNIYIYAEIPGVEKDNIDVDFFNNDMTIKIEKNRTYDTPQTPEIKFGKFERTVKLPICVTKKETVTVNCNNGLLRIVINKLVEEENKFSVKVKPSD